jgi:CheY-like chemotaxis protein
MKPLGKGPPPKRAAIEQQREVLLYVEDDDRNWEVAELRLKNHYNMVRARTAEEACDQIVQHAAALSAILMDIQLQGSALDGIHLTQLIRGTLPRLGLPRKLASMPVLEQVPIIFVTAHAARYAEAELLAAGGDRALTKPVEFGQLMLLLANIYLKKRAR